jgi:K+-transporting ATPase A subunit
VIRRQHHRTVDRRRSAASSGHQAAGTNGGGWQRQLGAPQNPTPLSNFVEMLAILLIPCALCYTFGRMIGDTRQGWALLATMVIVMGALLAGAYIAEGVPNPVLAQLGVDPGTTGDALGANLEGKEVRHGIANSVLWATVTTAASNGAVNAMRALMPLTGLVPMWLMQLGEVIYGGVGSGLYGMIVFAIVTVFIAGLMIGRTPEYLGKKIEAFDIKMAAIVVLIPLAVVLGGTALAVMLEAGKAGVANPGAHGFSEVLYAFSSAGNNNGSAFAGLSANTPFYNTAWHHVLFALLARHPGAGAGRYSPPPRPCRRRRDPRHCSLWSDRYGDHRRCVDVRAGAALGRGRAPAASPRNSRTNSRKRHDHLTERRGLAWFVEPQPYVRHCSTVCPADPALPVAQPGRSSPHRHLTRCSGSRR